MIILKRFSNTILNTNFFHLGIRKNLAMMFQTFSLKVIGFYETASPYFSKPRIFSRYIVDYISWTVITIINLQIAYYLGFKEVYLIGMDFSYDIPNSAITSGLEIESTEDDPNHFILTILVREKNGTTHNWIKF